MYSSHFFYLQTTNDVVVHELIELSSFGINSTQLFFISEYATFAKSHLLTSGDYLSDMLKKCTLNPHKRPTEADQFSADSANGSLSGFLPSCGFNKLRIQQDSRV